MHISFAEHGRRRRNLMDDMALGSVALVPGASNCPRNRDVDYPFRQDSDFWYLTGFAEPDALLVLAPGREEAEAILFCQEREEKHELYNGERLGPGRAAEALGLDAAFPLAKLDEQLPKLLNAAETIYAPLGERPEFGRRLLVWLADSADARRKREAVPLGQLVALGNLLAERRLIKSETEQRLMGQAAQISAAAQLRAMARCRPGLNETQLEAELIAAFMESGARAGAYPSIVGGGANACVLHYMANDAPLRQGDLVLIDAGCEWQHYAADITRTFPVNGRFSDHQRALYEIVLEAQKRAIAACRPGADCDAPHQAAVRVIVEGLVSLGLLSGTVEESMERQDYKDFFPHQTSHWLGLDVHDVGTYRVGKQWRTLRPGMALTIEPGIYVQPSNAKAPAKWRGMGIRIEDDLLIGEDGPQVLTGGAPKEIADVEAAMNGG